MNDEVKAIHVIPVDDLKEHTHTTVIPCECKPRVVIENSCVIVIHNSYDGREGVELAKEVLNNTEPFE